MKHCMNRTAIMLIVAGSALAATVPAEGQDLRDNSRRSLFSDQKASRIGETVTILVVETTVASNDASTSAARNDDINFGATANTGSATGSTNVGVTVGSGSNFRGQGSTSTKGSVRAKITANVDSVLANGNLVINGSRRIVINQEEQTIKISGVVRPSDIQADNSVYSYNISDATILMEGNGLVEKVQGPGLITKFLHFLF
jgi:flagellar L-ring protein precursor FlgH